MSFWYHCKEHMFSFNLKSKPSSYSHFLRYDNFCMCKTINSFSGSGILRKRPFMFPIPIALDLTGSRERRIFCVEIFENQTEITWRWKKKHIKVCKKQTNKKSQNRRMSCFSSLCQLLLSTSQKIGVCDLLCVLLECITYTLCYYMTGVTILVKGLERMTDDSPHLQTRPKYTNLPHCKVATSMQTCPKYILAPLFRVMHYECAAWTKEVCFSNQYKLLNFSALHVLPCELCSVIWREGSAIDRRAGPQTTEDMLSESPRCNDMVADLGYTPLFMSVKRLPVKVYHNCSP